MREIDIDLLRTLLRYEPDTGRLFWLRRDVGLFEATPNKTAEQLCKWWNGCFAGAEAFTATGNHGCRHGKLFNTAFYAHRVAWAIQHGFWPEHEIDHINGNRADNRIENLRAVDHQTNMQNKKLYRSNGSGEHGVSYHPGKDRWQAYITVSGSRRHVGTFRTVEAAIDARRNAQRAAGVFHRNHGRAA